jgi:hypothetical protein
VVWLPDGKLAALIEPGRGWPWNGYELKLMKAAGKYSPQRLKLTNVLTATGSLNKRLD